MSSSDPNVGVVEDDEQAPTPTNIQTTMNDIEVEKDPSMVETEQQPTPPVQSPAKDVPWSSSINNGKDESVIANIVDVENSVYFLYPDWKTRQSRFWMLLISAAIIATAGVVGDATATVIGASTLNL
jgi:hypothetical protein